MYNMCFTFLWAYKTWYFSQDSFYMEISFRDLVSSSLKIIFKILFIDLLLAVLGLCCSGLFSSCGERGLLSSCSAQPSLCSGFSCCGAQASGYAGFSSCGTWAQQLQLPGSRAQAQYLCNTGLVALRHVGSSWNRDRTRVSCIGRRILYHWATRETLTSYRYS